MHKADLIREYQDAYNFLLQLHDPTPLPAKQPASVTFFEYQEIVLSLAGWFAGDDRIDALLRHVCALGESISRGEHGSTLDTRIDINDLVYREMPYLADRILNM